MTNTQKQHGSQIMHEQSDSLPPAVRGISVVLPVYNEERYLADSITSIKLALAKLSGWSWEVVVVDNGSTDNSVSVAQSAGARVLSCVKKGPSACRNMGALHSNYDFLTFVDGDCLVDEDWMERVVCALSEDGVGAFGGPVLAPIDGNWVEKSWSSTSIKPFRTENGVLPGCNFSIRKSVFLVIGGFNEDLITAEDDELSNRLKSFGLKVIYDSRHHVTHLGYPKTILEIFLKQIWHGSSQLRAHGIAGDKMVVLTLLFLLSFIGMVVSGLLNSMYGFFISLLAMCFIPALVTYARLRNRVGVSIRQCISVYGIAIFFIFGRSVGLVRELTLILKEKRHGWQCKRG